MAAKLKTGDKVVVLSGKDKGTEGEILSVGSQGRQGGGSRVSTLPSATRSKVSVVRVAASPRKCRSICRTWR